MDKTQFSTSWAPVPSPSSTSLEQKSSRYSAWPFSLLMLLMLACMGASACIIVVSDGQPVISWKVQPAVLLAIISSVWNYAAGTMIAIAVTITWWKNFFRGTTVRNLHYIWKRGSGFSLASSFQAGVDARNIVLLASLIFLMQAFNNPLLQRSTHVEARNITVTETMKLNMISPLPDGLLVRMVNATAPAVIGLREGMSVYQGMQSNKPMSTHNTTGFRCDGVCDGKVKGTGFRSKCNSTSSTLDYSSTNNTHSTIFDIRSDLYYNATGSPVVYLKTIYASSVDENCMATIKTDICTIESSIVEYPIMIHDNIVTLSRDKLDNMTILSEYISPGDLSTVLKGQGGGPLQSINNNFGYLAGANPTVLTVDNTTKKATESGGGLSDLFFKTEDTNYNQSIIHTCGLAFYSPTNYSIQFMHEFMFRAAIQNSSDADTQTFEAERSNVILVFKSNYHYLAAVLIAKFLVLLGLFSQIWAWWELRWNVSMSPMETASALGAPALQQVRGREALHMMKIVGDMGVIYGDGVHFGRVDIPMAQMQHAFH